MEQDESILGFLRGFAFEGALGVCLVVLRLLGAIDWPWWVVASPFFAPVVFLFLVALLCWTVDDEEREEL
jgi:hypothetical protein